LSLIGWQSIDGTSSLVARTKIEHTSCMDAPGPIDPEVLRRMCAVITTAIGTRTKTIAEAAAEARGLGCGL